MPRQRRQRDSQLQSVVESESLTQEEVVATIELPVAQATPNNKTERKQLKMGLTQDQVNSLLANTRSKGQYASALTEFIASADQGVCVTDEWAEFEDKKPATLKQGFDNAINSKNAPEGASGVRVIANDDKVYLVKAAPATTGEE
jgi:hypothetical protein